MGLLADTGEHVDPFASSISTPERQRETCVHDSALPIDRGMAHVHRARCVHGHIAGVCRESDLRKSPTLPGKGRLYQGSVGSRDDGELARAFVCARH
jgi:hypothetical protein